jgi:hypothetical protein
MFPRLNHIAVVGGFVSGIILTLSTFSIVHAQRFTPNNSKTYTCTSGTACVSGEATSGVTYGVYASAGSGFAVKGSSNYAGVTGYTSSTNGGSGVSGVSTANSSSESIGVDGVSLNGPGVYGTSSAADGLEGVSSSNNNVAGGGVLGSTNSYDGNGVFAQSYDSSGVYAALYALGDKAKTLLFLVFNNANKSDCVILQDAALSCSGTIGGSALQGRHRTDSGRRVLAYALESATATIQDTGTARMFGGVADVQLDPAFAAVTDHAWYYVFLTPLGASRGLYVSMKTSSAFQVREDEHGHDSLAFDYRIVAHPLDARNDRLPPAPELSANKAPARPAP